MTFTFSSDAMGSDEMGLFCDSCDEMVCMIDEGDDLDIIRQCALDHADECAASSADASPATTEREASDE